MTLEGGSVPGQGLRRREDIYAEINLSERASRDASGLREDPHSRESGATEQALEKRQDWAGLQGASGSQEVEELGVELPKGPRDIIHVTGAIVEKFPSLPRCCG